MKAHKFSKDEMNNNSKVDIRFPVESSHVGPAPLVIRAIVTPTNDMIVGGVPSDPRVAEDYVLLSALPQELQGRIRNAVEVIISSI